MDHFLRYGPQHKAFEANLVGEILAAPAAIFEGLRDNLERGLCYAGVPSCRYTNKGNTGPPPPGMTFLVFVTPSYRIYLWRWEQVDPDAAGHPAAWETRFERRVWWKK